MFFGREDVFGWIERSLEGKFVDHILVLHGQRRVGKTSVLKQIPNFLPDKYLQVFFDLQGRTGTTLDRFLWWLASEIARTLKREHGINVPKPDRKAFKDTEYLINEFLPSIRPALGDNALLLTFDEFDSLDRSEIKDTLARPLIVYLRRLIEVEGLNFIFSIGSSGDKLENMQASYTDFFKSALYRKISFLTGEDIQRLVTKPVEGLIKYEKKAVRRIGEITSGHPYFTQLMCHELFSRCQKTGARTISADDVEAVLEDVVERGTVNLKFVWDEASDLEKWILATLVQMDGGNNQKLAQALTSQRVRFSESDLNSAVIHLRDKDVITEENRFMIHLMRLWLVANRSTDRVREELVEVNPIANRFIEIGDEYRDRDQIEQAIESYQQALNANPGNLKAQTNIASVHLDQKDYDEAATAFEAALKIDDEDVVAKTGYCDANLALGDAARDRGENDQAIALYQKIIVINAAHTDARQRLAAIYREQAERQLDAGRDDEALQYFNRAMEFTPEDDSLSARYNEILAQKKAKLVADWLGKAEKALSRKRWDEAAGMVEEAIKVDPENEELAARLAEVKDAPRQHNLQGYRREAEGAIARGNWEKAIAALETAIQLAPDDKSLAEKLSAVQSDQLNAQLDLYRKNAEKAMAAGDWEAAIAARQSALKLAPEDPKLKSALEETRQAQHQAQLDQFQKQVDEAVASGNWEAAIQAAQAAIKFAPKDAAWKNKLDEVKAARHQAQLDDLRAQANVAKETQQWDQAITALKEYHKLEPDDKNIPAEIEQLQVEKRESELVAFKSQAERAAKTENWDEAVESWESYLALEPDDGAGVEAELQHARKYAKIAGDYAEAQEAIRKKRYGRAIELLQGIIAQEPTYKSTSRLLVEAVEANKAIPLWRRPWVLPVVGIMALVVLGIYFGPQLWETVSTAVKRTPASTETALAESEEAITPTPTGNTVTVTSAEDSEAITPTPTGNTVTVTSAEDSETGTLRQALLDAQAGDTIIFDPFIFPSDSPTTIFLSSETLPRVSQGGITIDASNAGVILDGSKLPGYSDFGLVISSDHNTVMGLQIINIGGAGIYLEGGSYNIIGGDRTVGTGPLGQGNLLSNNWAGIGLLSTAGGNVITGNLIGINVSGAEPMGNIKSGIWIEDVKYYSHTPNTIGPDNVIAYNGNTESVQNGEITGGIVIDTVLVTTTITANSIYENTGPGIRYSQSDVAQDPPVILYFDLDSGSVSGHTCEGCIVEIFSTETQDGIIYEGTVTADENGNFSFSKGEALSGPFLTAMTRPPGESTSEFSQATSTVSAVQITLDTIKSEEPLYQTSIDSWDFTEPQENASIENGKLIVTGGENQSTFVHQTNFQSEKFAVEFETQILESGPGGGCLLNLGTDNEYGIRTIFSPSGEVEVDHLGVDGYEITIGNGQFDPANPSTATLIVLDNQFSLFIDGQLAFTALDPEGSAVYTGVSYEADSQMECAFDNFKFWDLSGVEIDQ